MSQQINLFNPVFLKQKKYFSVVSMFWGLLLIICGSALFYWYAIYQVKLLTQQSAETSRRFTAEQQKLANYTEEFSPQKAAQQLADEVKRAEANAAAQQEIIATLRNGDIGNTSGYSEYMRAFARQVTSGLWLTDFNIVGDGKQLSVKGAVLSPDLVPIYIQRLSHESIFRGKTVATLQLQRVSEARYVSFTLQSDSGAAK
ncbi:MAG: PilN domain-containing protein [Pseudomonadota bacterium]